MSTLLFGNVNATSAQEKETTYETQYEFTMNNLNQYNGLRVKKVEHPTIYLIDNVTKRGITSPAAMDKYKFRWDAYRVIMDGKYASRWNIYSVLNKRT